MAQAVTQGRFVQDITSPLEGSLKDWPSNIQDKVYALVLHKAMEEGKPYEVVDSFCDVDPVTGQASIIIQVEARYKVS